MNMDFFAFDYKKLVGKILERKMRTKVTHKCYDIKCRSVLISLRFEYKEPVLVFMVAEL